MGSLRNLARIHRASPISTWAGQNLDTQQLGMLVTRDDATWTARKMTSEVTLREIPLYRVKIVMVQGDQAEGLGFLY